MITDFEVPARENVVLAGTDTASIDIYRSLFLDHQN